MFLRSALLATLLSVSAIASADPTSYTYTGNVFTKNDVSAGTSQLVAHFDFDFANSTGAAQDNYVFTHWDVSGAGLTFSSADTHTMFNKRFVFDAHRNIIDWSISAIDGHYSAAFATSTEWDVVSPNITSGPYATVYANPGKWTFQASPVPEPSIAVLLMCALTVGGLSRLRARTK